MDHLIAKTKGRNNGFRKVISDRRIFEQPQDLENYKAYDPRYKLEEDEWYAINDFSENGFCIDFLIRPFVSTDFDQIPLDSFNNIEYLCAIQEGVYYFQKVGSKQFIRKKILSLNSLSLTENEPVIVINDTADAIYNKNQDRLYFKSLPSITSIFKGIDLLYREATQQETQNFLESNFIKLDNGYSATLVKTPNRKRIALVMDTLNNFSTEQKENIFKYISSYCEDLNFSENDGNFTITSEDDLKKLLYGIEERYYTTQSGGEKRLANSVTRL